MSIAARIRAWLAQAPGSTTAEIVAGAGFTGRPADTCRQTLGCMVRDGMIAQDRTARPYRYTLAREPMSEAERQARFQAGRARINEITRQKAAERRAAREAAYAAQKADRDAQARLKALQRPAAQKTVRRINDLSVANTNAMKAAPKVETIRTETYEEFIARGGKAERIRAHWEAA